MITALRPDRTPDTELNVAIMRYCNSAVTNTIAPRPGTRYGSRAWILEHLGIGRRIYEVPHYDDDTVMDMPHASCRMCQTVIVNIGEPMCLRCVKKFKMCTRCRNNQLYLDWDYYHPKLCKMCLVQMNGQCMRCERPAVGEEGVSNENKNNNRCHAHLKSDDVKIPKDRFWAPDFSVIEECPARPEIIV